MKCAVLMCYNERQTYLKAGQEFSVNQGYLEVMSREVVRVWFQK